MLSIEAIKCPCSSCEMRNCRRKRIPLVSRAPCQVPSAADTAPDGVLEVDMCGCRWNTSGRLAPPCDQVPVMVRWSAETSPWNDALTDGISKLSADSDGFREPASMP